MCSSDLLCGVSLRRVVVAVVAVVVSAIVVIPATAPAATSLLPMLLIPPKLVTVLRVVAMHVVEDAVWSVLLLGGVLCRARLLVLGLYCKDSLRLALGVRPGQVQCGQGLLLLQFWGSGEEMALLGLGALVGHLKELDDGRELEIGRASCRERVCQYV